MTRRSLTRSAALGLTVAALAAPAAVAQDLRSPDAQDARRSVGVRYVPPGPDLRAPDTRDLAEGRGTFNAPEVTVVKVTEPAPPSDGLDWRTSGSAPAACSA